MDAGLLLTALQSDRVDISVGYGTEGRIKKYGLEVIEDDKNFFPPYNVTPMVMDGFKDKFPECYEVMNTLSGKITDSEMQELNLMVSDSDASPRDAAIKYLTEAGLI